MSDLLALLSARVGEVGERERQDLLDRAATEAVATLEAARRNRAGDRLVRLLRSRAELAVSGASPEVKARLREAVTRGQ